LVAVKELDSLPVLFDDRGPVAPLVDRRPWQIALPRFCTFIQLGRAVIPCQLAIAMKVREGSSKSEIRR
jgi:hypothetical protein